MCDYSLMSLPNRLAAEGEELVVHRFPTGSIGFTSVADLDRDTATRQARSFWQRLKDNLAYSERCGVPAVCIPPAARLLLRNIDADMREKHRLSAEEEVRFVQLSADPHTYRDALCFRNGAVLRLQQLPVGLRAIVLDLTGESGEEQPFEVIDVLTGSFR